MHLGVTIGGLWLIVFAGVALAQPVAPGCPGYAKPIKLNFVTDNAATTYNNELNVTGIRDTMRTRGTTIAGPHQRALGITSSQIGLNISGKTFAVPAPAGYCVYLREVNATFGYRTMDVFIASEYRPSSCEYNAIIDHENQHVAINREALKQYAPRIRQVLEQQMQTLQPKFTLNPQTGTDHSVANLQLMVTPLMDEMEQVLSERNAVIDNNVNYSAIGELCKNWDKSNVWPPAQPAPNRGESPAPRIKDLRPAPKQKAS